MEDLIKLVSNLLAAVAGVSREKECKCLKTWFMNNEGAYRRIEFKM